ncbi:MAG: Uma2 family endonuclease [Acidimicrobiales bacterium]
MATRPRQLTAENLYAFPDDGTRYELVKGELSVMAPSGFEHGDISGVVVVRIGSFVLERRLGRILTADAGFILARDPDTLQAPDVAFVRADRIPPPEDRRRFAELAPDLVVEVVSPSDRPGDVTAKALRWAQAGVKLVWVIHPEERTVAVYEPGGAVTVVDEGGELDGGEVLPGFRLAVAELFQ